MSYCRGPIYAYYDGDNWNIHVGRDVDIDDRRYYQASTPEAFRNRLLALQAEGFEVPQTAIDRISREITEGKFNKASEIPACDHDWVRDGQIARCAREGCDYVRKPQGDERKAEGE